MTEEKIIVEIPLTGEVISKDPIIGNPDDPVSLLPMRIDAEMRVLSFDWEKGTAMVEIFTKKKRRRFDDAGNPLPDETDAAHEGRRIAEFAKARVITNKSTAQQYADSRKPRLKNPFKVIE